jgi:acetolactate synthase small subunit
LSLPNVDISKDKITEFLKKLQEELDFVPELVTPTDLQFIHRSGIAVVKINTLSNQITWTENDMA